MTVPILLISDAPSAMSGLGRITRDLATRLHARCSDIYDVATLGYGGVGDKTLPFPQYHIESMKDWFIPSLQDVWQNFAGARKGIGMTIWDASRTLWFARPESACPDKQARQWLMDAPFRRWSYPAMDATGPHGRLSYPIRECLSGYDRVVAYSKWAEDMIRASMNIDGLTSLPHGIDTSIFRPRPRAQARRVFKETLQFNGPELQDEERIIGIIATNQERKDFGLAMEAVSHIKDTPFRLYIQTDLLERKWSIPALLMDYGLMSRAIVNCNPVTDETMAEIYSACDVTLGIGLGEGFSYTAAESLACGTPHITGSYGGHAEWVPEEFLIDPQAWRVEGLYNSIRPVFEAELWTDRIETYINVVPHTVSLLPKGLEWETLWPRWETWFREGLK